MPMPSKAEAEIEITTEVTLQCAGSPNDTSLN